MSVAGARINMVQQSYVRLWKAFSDAATEEGLVADSATGQGALVKQCGGNIVSESLLLLRAWPYKVGSTKKHVDIAVQVEELFDDDHVLIMKATTQVGYFRRSTSSEVPILELHYDYEMPELEAHPIFHVQVGITKWPEEHLKQLGFPHSIERVPEKLYGKARIPTAFMGFAPILVALAADHLSPKGFRAVVTAARSVEPGVHDPACERLKGSLTVASGPHAHHWYDVKYVAYRWTEQRDKIVNVCVPLMNVNSSGRNSFAVEAQVAKQLGVSVGEIVFREGKPPREKRRRPCSAR